MVAYSFKSGFIPAIHAGTKRQTIRLPRKRHARPGEQLQFFTGPRMAPVRIGSADCLFVRDVRLDFDKHEVVLDDAILLSTQAELNQFAVRDGFDIDRLAQADLEPWEYMGRWWRLTHPGHRVFTGVLIDWSTTFVPVLRGMSGTVVVDELATS